MLVATKITEGEIDVRRELAILGLQVDDLVNAILFGETHRNFCTDDDPLIFHGTTAWARTLRGMRQTPRLLSLGWRRDRHENFETIVSPDESFAICVATGDAETGKFDSGKPEVKPRTKNPKGIMLKVAVDVNTWLFPELADDAEAKKERLRALNRRATWILLIHRDKDRVYAELSLPSEFNVNHISNWGHRILLNPIDIEPVPVVRGDSEDYSDEIFVPVEKISNQ